jgi:hypothetical protein
MKCHKCTHLDAKRYYVKGRGKNTSSHKVLHGLDHRNRWIVWSSNDCRPFCEICIWHYSRAVWELLNNYDIPPTFGTHLRYGHQWPQSCCQCCRLSKDKIALMTTIRLKSLNEGKRKGKLKTNVVFGCRYWRGWNWIGLNTKSDMVLKWDVIPILLFGCNSIFWNCAV